MKSNKTLLRVAAAVFGSACTAVVSLQAISSTKPGSAAADHIRANIAAEASKDESTTIKITLRNAQGKSQERILDWKTITLPGGDKRTLVTFTLPKSIRGTGLLIHENRDKEDERWLYLPALKKARRISGADKSDTFMGTDFSYEDLVTEEIEHYNYAYAADQSCGNRCVAIIATPKTEQEKRESGYSKRVIVLDTETRMVISVDYYNKSGTHSKSYRASEFRRIQPSGAIRPHRMEMTDLINRHTSVMVFDAYRIDSGVDASAITLRALTQGQ